MAPRVLNGNGRGQWILKTIDPGHRADPKDEIWQSWETCDNKALLKKLE